jgi:uncharacterized protein DUF3617
VVSGGRRSTIGSPTGRRHNPERRQRESPSGNRSVKQEPYRAVLLAALTAVASTSAQAEQTIQAGLWQFTSEGGLPASAIISAPSGSQSQVASGFTNCIDPARSVPIDPKFSCQVNSMNNRDGAVTWATTCTTPQGTFQTRGAAQYSADSMTGTLSTYVPMVGGQITQRISGRYLGPCSAR